VNAALPPGAVNVSKGTAELTFDLRSVFHHAYIDKHERRPVQGTNPLFDEYAPLLAKSPYLVFDADNIASGDYLPGVSHDLGRAFARALLNKYGYRWFGDLKRIRGKIWRDYVVTRKKPGNMPDWLVAGSGRAAFAEAKGTKTVVKKTSKRLHEWRVQVANALALHKGIAQQVKSWIIATQWVANKLPQQVPIMYVEDPPLPGAEPTDGEQFDLELFVARFQIAHNLVRLGLERAAQRVLASREFLEWLPRTPLLIWQCDAPELGGLSFVGSPISGNESSMPWWPWLWSSESDILQRWQLAYRGMYWFDGLARSAVESVTRGRIPEPFAMLENSNILEVTPGVSLLPDGSLIAPAERMQLTDVIEI
jgi:hypothetical protein